MFFFKYKFYNPFLWCAILFTLSTSAQIAPTPKAITTADGLGFRAVTALAQDSRGFLWLGTQRGVDMYDGYRFIHLNKEKSADYPFPADDVLGFGLHILNDSTLWVIGDHRLYTINLHTFESSLVEEFP